MAVLYSEFQIYAFTLKSTWSLGISNETVVLDILQLKLCGHHVKEVTKSSHNRKSERDKSVSLLGY